MSENSNDPAAPNTHCSRWGEIVQWIEDFPSPELNVDSEGEVTGAAWVFRGLRDSRYKLQPTIEREAETKSMEWAALEVLVSSEFKSRAHMHLSASSIPGDELTWLAQMQHYAIPTRLLDFTHSPFVALYFAIRSGQEREDRARIRLWAINAANVNSRFRILASRARSAQQKREGKQISHRVRSDPDSAATDRDNMIIETDGFRALIAESLSASEAYRGALNRSGGVSVAAPPAFNPRLASQQGVFLLNCAEGLSLSNSLIAMMQGITGWCKTADIDIEAIPDLEQKLYPEEHSRAVPVSRYGGPCRNDSTKDPSALEIETAFGPRGPFKRRS